MWTVLIISSVLASVSEELKEEACITVVDYLSKNSDFDLKKLITVRPENFSPIITMHGVLSDMFSVCIEKISDEDAEGIMESKDYPIQNFLGFDIGKYKTGDLPVAKPDFFQKFMSRKSKIRHDL